MKDVTRDELIPHEFPDFSEVKARADRIAAETTIGRTLFMEKYGVKSEAEYKEQCKASGQIMHHCHIGWNDFDETCENIEYIYRQLTDRGVRLDRFGICLDASLGVPEDRREGVAQGAGQILSGQHQWDQLGQIVPVQPHFGDNTIGTLNSVPNLVAALRAGGTTVGNVSHYYTYEYSIPYSVEERTIGTVEALGVMAALRDQGTLVHSNLDDGYGAMFHDLANLLGWAKLEKHIVEDLIGARLGHCFGNLFDDPAIRMVFALALDDINDRDSLGSMIYGNTTDYRRLTDDNYSVLVGYMQADMLVQLHRPMGHAIVAVPTTEASRIPSKEEIVEAQTISWRTERLARWNEPYVNWGKLEGKAARLVVGADVFYDHVMNGLEDMGIDLENPMEMMQALKKLRPTYLETRFGAGKRADVPRGHVPVMATDVVKTVNRITRTSLENVRVNDPAVLGRKAVVGSTDVHEFGKDVVLAVLKEAGIQGYDLGIDVGPKNVVDSAIETSSDLIVISTYNGVALSFAKALQRVMADRQVELPVVMGGILNENSPGSSLPVDVSQDLEDLGVRCCDKAEDLVVAAREALAQ